VTCALKEGRSSYISTSLVTPLHTAILKTPSDVDKKVTAKLNFRTPSPVEKALKSAKNLSHHSSRVAVSKDLSYENREKMRSAVKKLRSKIKEQPELHWVIQGFQVVNLGPRRRKIQTKVNSSYEEICYPPQSDISDIDAIFGEFLKSRIQDCTKASETTSDSDSDCETDNLSSRGPKFFKR